MLPPLETLSRAVWDNGVQASLLIVSIVLVRIAAGRRAPAQWFHCLWIVAALRLMTPLLPPGIWSVYHYLSASPSATILQSPAWQVRVEDVERASALPMAIPANPHARSTPPRQINGLWWTCRLWLVGLCLQVAFLGWGVLRFRRVSREAAPVRDRGLLTLVSEAARTLKLRTTPDLGESDEVRGPSVLGFWRPCILLPFGLADRLSPEELRLVLLHECAHLRRWDLATLWLLLVVRAVHWWNPLVWLAVYLARTDLELACDETVLCREHAPERYGETLLKLAQAIPGKGLALPAVGMLQNRRTIHSRLARIALFAPSTSARAGLPALAVVALAIFGFGLTSAHKSKSKMPSPDSL